MLSQFYCLEQLQVQIPFSSEQIHGSIARLLSNKPKLTTVSFLYANGYLRPNSRNYITQWDTVVFPPESNLSQLWDPTYVKMLDGEKAEGIYIDASKLKQLSQEEVFGVYDQLTAALINCKKLEACAFVKNHSEFVFMDSLPERRKKLNSQNQYTGHVLAFRSFHKSFEQSLLRAQVEHLEAFDAGEIEQSQFLSKLCQIDGFDIHDNDAFDKWYIVMTDDQTNVLFPRFSFQISEESHDEVSL